MIIWNVAKKKTEKAHLKCESYFLIIQIPALFKILPIIRLW